MKKLALKLGISIAIIVVLYQFTIYWNPVAIQNKTAAFLDKVKEQKYEDAYALYGGVANPDNWTDGMRKLHNEEGFRLLAYDNVKAIYDDGTFGRGHADLTFEIDGKPLKVDAVLTFGSGAKPRQVCAVRPPGIQPGSIPELAAWNQLVCGSSF